MGHKNKPTGPKFAGALVRMLQNTRGQINPNQQIQPQPSNKLVNLTRGIPNEPAMGIGMGNQYMDDPRNAVNYMQQQGMAKTGSIGPANFGTNLAGTFDTTQTTTNNDTNKPNSRRERRIEDLKRKLGNVKATTMSLADKSEKTGDYKEVIQKDAIINRKHQAKRIEKRINRKEGREERRKIRKEAREGKITRGQKIDRIAESKKAQYKKRKDINQNKTSNTSKSSNSQNKSSNSQKNNTTIEKRYNKKWPM